MKNLIISFIGVAIFILVAGLLLRKYNDNSPRPIVVNTNLPRKRVTVDDISISADIADTPKTREVGLGGRDEIREGEGMIFIFPQKDVVPTFWMKGMKFPIDILWINDNKVSGCERNVQPPLAEQNEMGLPLYKPRSRVDYVLETKAGFCDRFGIQVGDVVNMD